MKDFESLQDSILEKKPKENMNPSSKLVKRLYRNSSLNRFNPNASLLSSNPHRESEHSFLNSSTGNQLVASISLKKFQKNNVSERSLEISQGKILITQHHENSQFKTFDSIPKKKLFKKLDKLDNTSTSKILPDVNFSNHVGSNRFSNLELRSIRIEASQEGITLFKIGKEK